MAVYYSDVSPTKIYRCVEGPLVETPVATSSLLASRPLYTEKLEETVVLPSGSVRMASPMPAYRRAASPLPTTRPLRALSPMPTVVSSPLSRQYVSRAVPGLDDYLLDLGLSQYNVRASDWAASRGYYFNDVVDNQVLFADALGLRPLERARLLRDGPLLAPRYLPTREVILG